MRPDSLDRLLARGRLSGREREAIFEGALRDARGRRWTLPRLLIWASPAAACAVALALFLGARAPADHLRAKGEGPRVRLGVECGGESSSRCASTDKILFRVEGVPTKAYLSAYAEPGDAGERVWFFPTAEGTAPEVEAGEAPRIFDRAVAARSLRAGAYQIHALLASRRLSREEILAASDESILARQTTRLEVGP